MNDYATHANAFLTLQKRLGNDCPRFSWNDSDWPIIPGSATRRKDLASGGFQLNADLIFEVLVAQFLDPVAIPDATALKDALLARPINYLGDDYKIDSIEIAPGGLLLTAHANSLHQNT